KNARTVVAHHEMGHALVTMSLPGSDPVHKVSIIPRGIGALGYTIQRPTENRFLMTAEELENKMAVLLGGRAAESLIFGRISTGAADDLAKVTDIARSMVMRYGMVEKLGNVAYEQERPLFLDGVRNSITPREFSEETSREIDEAVRDFIRKAYAKALSILSERRPMLENCAKQLLEHETLTEEELRQLCPAPAPPA
ncbi:MAG: cell division protein FtsH, partial [Burkholderiales bacterium]